MLGPAAIGRNTTDFIQLKFLKKLEADRFFEQFTAEQ
jgi:hypothetical protein